MKSIFEKTNQQEILERVARLSENSQAQWGKMSVGQMCEHCARAIDVNAGVIEEEKPSFFVKLMKPMIKKVVFGQKPYSKNSPTSPQFKVTEQIDFENAKQHLINSLHFFTDENNKEKVINHPSKVFGKLTEQEKGWAQYKHLNHHLEQFGV